MGFLDHSTNNIIVDAVLTDVGRRALARNDGSFNVYQYALGDDEVDYTIIKQYGRTVGREKIEKNTPIMEALTAGSMGLKNKLMSTSNEFLTHLPVMELTLSATPVALTRNGSTTTSTVDVKITPKTGVRIPDDLIDGELRVEMNQLFLGIVGEAPDIVYTDNIAVYTLPATFGSDGSVAAVTGKVRLRLKSFSDTTFNSFSASGKDYIRSFVKVRGINSGLTKSFEVQISNSSTTTT